MLMFYSCGNVNSDAAVITVPSSSSGLEAQMFFLTCGIMETSSVQMLLTNTQTQSTLISWPLGCSSKRHQSLPLTQTVEDRAAFFSVSRLKTDHTASQDWKQINRQLTSLTPWQMLWAKVGCWGGVFVPTFAWRVCGADKGAGQQELCFHSCMDCPVGSPGTGNPFCWMAELIFGCTWYNLSSLENSSEQHKRQELLGIIPLCSCFFINSKKARSRKSSIVCPSLGINLRIKLNFTLAYNVSENVLLLSWRPGLNRGWNREDSV